MTMSSRHNQKGRSKTGGQFVPIPYNMARSDAWRSLGGAAVKVYVELRSRYNGGNNGELFLSFAEASDLLGIGKSTAKRAFDELWEKRLIIKTSDGSFRGRRASTWAVTDRPLRKGEPVPNSWQSWRYPKNGCRYSSGTMRHVAFRRGTGGEKKTG
jgi:hypothetical protein